MARGLKTNYLPFMLPIAFVESRLQSMKARVWYAKSIETPAPRDQISNVSFISPAMTTLSPPLLLSFSLVVSQIPGGSSS